MASNDPDSVERAHANLAAYFAEKDGPPKPPPATPQQIADIARENGLDLPAAAALRSMATTVDEAKKIAETFRPESMRQLTKDDLKGMSSEAIIQARDDGRLRDLLTSTGTAAPATEKVPEGQLTRAEMLKLTPAQRVQAREDGKLDHMLGIVRPAKK
ncbi:MAG TPA: hypothetical protein VJ787_05035 [Thermoleophilia bacterium]|nr:hypothetical protein [Thermoleophilia bacterium]